MLSKIKSNKFEKIKKLICKLLKKISFQKVMLMMNKKEIKESNEKEKVNELNEKDKINEKNESNDKIKEGIKNSNENNINNSIDKHHINDDMLILCKICLTNRINIIIFPCQHACFCHDCWEKMPVPKNCPICQGIVISTIDVIIDA